MTGIQSVDNAVICRREAAGHLELRSTMAEAFRHSCSRYMYTTRERSTDPVSLPVLDDESVGG